MLNSNESPDKSAIAPIKTRLVSSYRAARKECDASSVIARLAPDLDRDRLKSQHQSDGDWNHTRQQAPNHHLPDYYQGEAQRLAH
jgi:hypothetical protein